MTKSSCIAHNANQSIVIIREDYLAICEKNHCAAAILNVFEYWTNIKMGQSSQAKIENAIAAAGDAPPIDDGLWIYKSVAELQEELLGLFGESKIAAALKMIESKGYVDTRHNPKYGWDRTIQYLFKTEVIHSVISRNGSLKNKKSKGAKSRNGNRKNKVAIPKTTTKDTSKRFIFDAILKYVFELTDSKGISGGRIGKLESVAKQIAATRLPSATPDDIAKHIERFARTEKFKPAIQGVDGFELRFAAYLQNLPPAVIPDSQLEIVPKLDESPAPMSDDRIAEMKRIEAMLMEKTNANAKPHDPYGGLKLDKVGA